ncbi:hypothetical protein ScPMuIL_015028 [Solemya velum]
MANDFDPEDKSTWYFGPLDRSETNEILSGERDIGVFLVRDSGSCKGDFVLCVKEDSKISHYIVNRIQVGTTMRYRIGDQEFPDLPSMLSFYKRHYLDTTSLIRPAQREKVIAKYDFTGRDEEDLPFKKGEILEVITKDEEKWWTAKNSSGAMGQIPVPYIQKYESNQVHEPVRSPAPIAADPPVQMQLPPLPAEALVIQERIPNLYDKTQLKLDKGERITVTKTNANGQWEGNINGRVGFFPFTHVKFFNPKNPDELMDGTRTQSM